MQDELGPLKSLVDDLTLIEPENITFIAIRTPEMLQAMKIACDQVRSGWLAAFFSEAQDHSLQRYFNFHLEGISKLADTFFSFVQKTYHFGPDQESWMAINDQLIDLIIHLKKYHERFFNDQVNSPILWRRNVLLANEPVTLSLINKLQEPGLPVGQTGPAVSYLKDMMKAEEGGFYTFHSLTYYENFIHTLTRVLEDADLNEGELNRQLTELNFNHIAYAGYRYSQIEAQLRLLKTRQEKVRLLLEERNKLKSVPFFANSRCHPRFPSITAMLDKWLCEQVIYIEEQKRPEPEMELCPHRPKLLLNLSVAQMGCLLRVLYEAECFGSTPLNAVLEFVTQHFSSKKQAVISIGGLSKEYYSTTQVTAGKVIMLFQRLIAILKRIFFPLLVVTGVIFGV